MTDQQLVAAAATAATVGIGEIVLRMRRRRTRRVRHLPDRLQFAGGVLDWPLLNTSLLATGQTGSGKSSVMMVLLRELLERGCGVYAPSAKPDDLDKLLRLCERAGRKDVTVVKRDGTGGTLNFFEDLCVPGADLETQAAHLSSGFDQLTEVLTPGGWGDDARYWVTGYQRLCRALVTLCLLSGRVPTVRLLLEVLQSCPRSADLKSDPAFKAGVCSQMLYAAFLTAKANPALRDVYDRLEAYLTKELPAMPEKSRGSFESMVVGPADILSKGIPNALLASEAPTLDIKAAVAANRVILTELSYGVDRDIATAVHASTKYLIQLAVLGRTVTPETKPYCLYLDEYSQVKTNFDVTYLTLQRSNKGPLLAAIQGVEFLRAKASGSAAEAETQTILGNFGVRMACGPQTPETVKFYTQAVGDRLGVTVSGNTSQSYDDPRDLFAGKSNASAGFSQTQLPVLTPRHFSRLRSGGVKNNRQVDVLVHAGGEDYQGECFTFATVTQE